MRPMTKIPKAFKENDKGTKYLVGNLDRPQMVSPSSSGRGEAMMMAPISGMRWRKRRRWKIASQRSLLWRRKSVISESETRSRTNRKIM